MAASNPGAPRWRTIPRLSTWARGVMLYLVDRAVPFRGPQAARGRHRHAGARARRSDDPSAPRPERRGEDPIGGMCRTDPRRRARIVTSRGTRGHGGGGGGGGERDQAPEGPGGARGRGGGGTGSGARTPSSFFGKISKVMGF